MKIPGASGISISLLTTPVKSPYSKGYSTYSEKDEALAASVVIQLNLEEDG